MITAINARLRGQTAQRSSRFDLILDVLPFGGAAVLRTRCDEGQPPRRIENDRPKRLFQNHGLDLCQTVRGLA